jgi:hypothetical protein
MWLQTVEVGFEVLTVLVMKSSTFWDITLCSPLKVNGSFTEPCCLYLQCSRIRQPRNQHEAVRKQQNPPGENLGLYRKQE